jgi:hypothetical protein
MPKLYIKLQVWKPKDKNQLSFVMNSDSPSIQTVGHLSPLYSQIPSQKFNIWDPTKRDNTMQT